MRKAGLLALAAALGAANAQTLYVSTEGRAGWSGRLAAPNAGGTDGPLPSLAAARDALRALRRGAAGQPATVLIREGVYHLTEPLALGPEDSAITFAAYAGEHVALCGGRNITGWRKGTGGLWTSEIPEVRSGQWYFRQLFVNGARAQRARSPNYGFYRIDGPSSQDHPFRLHYRNNEIRPEWAGTSAEVIALLAWAEIRMPIRSVDPEARVAVLGADPRKSNREADARYWIENVPEALDAPGEWYLEAKSGVLSYRQQPGDDLTKDDVVAPAIHQLVRLEGRPEEGRFVRQVSFRGLRFCHTDYRMDPNGYADPQGAIQREKAGGGSDGPAAVFEGTGAENCSIEQCTFTQHGDYAIWFGRGSKHNRVVGNEIADMGGGGVLIGETRMRENEAERNVGNEITDNNIHHLGLIFPAAHGVWVGQSSDNTISHNHIHDLFYTAVSVGWTWGYAPNQCRGNRIEYNHLHHIGQGMLSDMGGIYTLGVQPGTVIRNNLIHDVEAFTYGGWGIYPDEGSSEELIENNVVYRTKSAGFHQHYGRENTVRNNIFAFGREFQLMRTRAEQHLSFAFERNIVYFDQGKLLGSNWTGGQFRMRGNLYWDPVRPDLRFAGKTFAEWKEAGQDAGSVIADPRFVDAGSYNFALRPGSPALQLGFQPIDLSGVGPRRPAGAGN